MGIAIVNSSIPALESAQVATIAILATEADAGCVVMVVVVITVGTPTVTSAVRGRPEAGGCSIHREGKLKNSKSSDDYLSS